MSLVPTICQVCYLTLKSCYRWGRVSDLFIGTQLVGVTAGIWTVHLKSQLLYHLFLLGSPAYNSPTPLTPAFFLPSLAWGLFSVFTRYSVCNCSFAFTYGIITTVYPCILGTWYSVIQLLLQDLKSYRCKAHDVENHSARRLYQRVSSPMNVGPALKWQLLGQSFSGLDTCPWQM